MTAPDLFDYAERKQAQAASIRISNGIAQRKMGSIMDDSDTLRSQYLAWKHTPYSGRILQQTYARASFYYKRFKRYGQRVSMKFIFEQIRDHIREVNAKARALGIEPTKWNGYAVNNSFTALVVRDCYDHHPEWEGLFELRERKAEKAEGRP